MRAGEAIAEPVPWADGGPPTRVLVTGASGLLGSALVPVLLGRGHTVAALTRRAPRAGEIPWDPARGILDARSLAGYDAVVHLAGEPIGVRWTPRRKTLIRASRVDATRLLAERLSSLERRPRVLVAISAIGIYGDRGDEILDEQSPPGTGFLPDLCRAWEAAAAPARDAGIRVVHPRLGLVLSPRGGTLARLLPPFRLGLGGPLGDGRAWWSWVALDDVLAVLLRALGDESLAGPVNVVAPMPVRSRDFARLLGRALKRPAFLPVPSWVLRALFGEMADGAVLASLRVEPARLRAAGHVFRFPSLEGALRSLLERPVEGRRAA
jgi:hypothetical protein